MTRVAALDCGTNSIRLLVADVDAAAGSLVDVERRLDVVRLGEGVDRTGVISAEALRRTLATCREYADRIAGHGADRVRFVATSATRDAGNRADLVDGVRGVLGVEPEVLSGDDEARLSFDGATRELAAGDVDLPCLVLDIGGGSTELVLGSDTPGGHTVRAAVSVDVGCVRLSERHLHGDPPTPAQVAAARADVEAALTLAGAVVELPATRTLVGLAGSVTTVAAMALRLRAYDPERLHHVRITAADVHEVSRHLLRMPRAARAALPFMHPGRVDVIAAGAMVLAAVVDATGVSEVLVSEHDILDGIAWSLVSSP